MNSSKVLVYSFVKYCELGIVAAVLLHFAKKSGPVSYGELSFFLVLISYSAFSVFGINASYVKLYSIEKDRDNRDKLTVFNFWYNFFIGVMVFLLIYGTVSGKNVLPLALICFLNLVRGSIQSIFRSELKVWRLSIFNVIFSVSYLSFYYFGVVRGSEFDAGNFLYYWAVSLTLTTVLGVGIIFPVLVDINCYSVSFIRANFSLLFKTAIALFIVNFGNTILLSSDRFLLNLFSAPLVEVGYYQFADNIASIFYLGSNSLLFLLVPVYMRKLSDGSISPSEFKKIFVKIGVVWIVPLVTFISIAYVLISFVFEEYIHSLAIVILLTISKYLCLLIFIPSTILTTFHQEAQLIRCYYTVIIPMIFIQALLVIILKDNYWLLSITSVVSVFVILLLLWQVRPKLVEIES